MATFRRLHNWKTAPNFSVNRKPGFHSVSENLLSPCPANERRQTHLGQLEALGMFPLHLSTVVCGMSDQLPVVGVGFSYRRAVRETMQTCTYTQSLPINSSKSWQSLSFQTLTRGLEGSQTVSWEGSVESATARASFLLWTVLFLPHTYLGPSSKKKGCSRCVSLKIHALPSATDELIGNKGHFFTKLLLQQRTAMTSK